MSTKRNVDSSTSSRSVRKSSGATPKMQRALAPVYIGSGIIEAESSSSSSPLRSIYEAPEFSVTADNDLSYHVALNALHLRRFREQSQADVARAMGTSQPKVARIEGADDNITIKTLKRLATALRGRIRFTIEPAELSFPQLPNWWEVLGSGMVSDDCTWTIHAAVTRWEGNNQQMIVGFKAPPTAKAQKRVSTPGPSAFKGRFSVIEIGA
jgi:transcriptional regulator with XRE-family HTH domain